MSGPERAFVTLLVYMFFPKHITPLTYEPKLSMESHQSAKMFHSLKTLVTTTEVLSVDRDAFSHQASNDGKWTRNNPATPPTTDTATRAHPSRRPTHNGPPKSPNTFGAPRTSARTTGPNRGDDLPSRMGTLL
ncbi:uncharacterized protein LOC132947227 [Metopolophium dirhodum]|uniref:uncharacterized protein LOC132947227 n=1 Tax=Metopolophium dirhodum TaxID=44670 RepID=UPI00298F599D|nr:uncharacterized protein LOC132947227 [Metopolophium dirhodum]